MRSPGPDWIRPDWQVPGVGALMTTRSGGVSLAPFDSLNLRAAVGDDPAAVEENTRRVASVCGRGPVYLNQVHGTDVVRLVAEDAMPGRPVPQADASITTDRGVACAVQVADCLPVLLAVAGGRGVGAAHAGWRGLALGVLERTLSALCEAAACKPSEVSAWLGPCIGPLSFEVGSDVLEAFASRQPGSAQHFLPSVPGRWLADLPSLAHDRLRAAGVTTTFGGTWCTVGDPSRFFSYRRDRTTGRMAALVWIDPPGDRTA